MRVALVSDVHGNAVSFETVIAELDRVRPDAVVCLGDLIQGGPEPVRCLELVRERGWPVVLGNADAFVLDAGTAATGVESVTERQLAQRAWTLEQLSADERAYVASFSPTVEVSVGPKRLLSCHAVPSSYDPVVLPTTPEDEFRSHLEGVDADVVAAGHVHLQFVRRAGKTVWVNPGSVGLSYDHEQPDDDFRFDPWAAYAFVAADEEGRLSVDFRRVPVDFETIVARVEACGMPGAAEGAWRWRPSSRP
jgi:predicted phosphodiesterase